MKQIVSPILVAFLMVSVAPCTGNGWAPSSEEISRIGSEGFFKGKSPEQIAPYLAHPHPIPAAAAAKALAAHGEKAVPFIKKLLKDSHPALRRGALIALGEMYRYEGEGLRTEIPPELAGVLRLIRPMIKDDDAWVRSTVTGLVKGLKVENGDIHEILYTMATDPAPNVRGAAGGMARYQIRDPHARVKVFTLITETSNKAETVKPTDFPLGIASTAHLEHMRESIPAALGFLDRHCLSLWGMFSDGPSKASMNILERFADDARVMAGLPIILKVYSRKFGGKNVWWTHLQEGPRRILLAIGPGALPAVQEFIVSERELFERYASGQAKPVNKWEGLKGGCEERFAELELTAELIRCLHDQKEMAEAVPFVCRIYLDKDWSDVERARMRKWLTGKGTAAVPLVREAATPLKQELMQKVDDEIAAKQKDAEQEKDHRKRRTIQQAIEKLGKRKDFVDERSRELEDMLTSIENAAPEKATPDAVKTLCRLYIRRSWPFQDELIRNRLVAWGAGAAPAIREFVESDKSYLTHMLAQFDEEEAHARKTLRFGRGLDGALVRLDLARKDLHSWYDELRDLASLVEWSAADRLPADAASELCRMYTRRGWESQNTLIGKILARGGAPALAAIREHIKAEEEALPEEVKMIHHFLPYTPRSRYKWQYERHKEREAKMRRGVRELRELIGEKGERD